MFHFTAPFPSRIIPVSAQDLFRQASALPISTAERREVSRSRCPLARSVTVHLILDACFSSTVLRRSTSLSRASLAGYFTGCQVTAPNLFLCRNSPDDATSARTSSQQPTVRICHRADRRQ